jgi:hypothetical protein
MTVVCMVLLSDFALATIRTKGRSTKAMMTRLGATRPAIPTRLGNFNKDLPAFIKRNDIQVSRMEVNLRIGGVDTNQTCVFAKGPRKGPTPREIGSPLVC